MSLPKEPRQKMINLMYLVLTALLALNVSSEIINAFKTINTSLVAASAVINSKNDMVYKTFEKKLQDPQSKEQAAQWQPVAQNAKKLADEMYAYLEALKLELKKESHLVMTEGVEVFKEDDLDAPQRFLVEGPKGDELLQKLTAFKANIVGVLKPESFTSPDVKKKVQDAVDGFKASLPIDLVPPKSSSTHGATEATTHKPWQSGYFRMTPTIAAITMISKFQNDVKNAESQIVDFCLKQVGAVEIIYDNFQAISAMSTEYAMPDQEITITGGVGAFSKAAQPNVTIDGTSVALNAEGVAEYKFKSGGPGSYSKKVNISFKKPDGSMGTVEKELKYTVGSPTGASVSADAVKVLYIGLDNPLTVSGGSAGAEKTNASINNGSLQNKGGGKYVAQVSNPGEAVISVSVEGKNGGDFKFKVKRIPDPIPVVGKSYGGVIPANEFKGQQGVRAELKDFVFEGVEYNIVSYTFVANGGPFVTLAYNPNQGAAFNAQTRAIIEKCTAGVSVTIDDIKAVGPDGTTRRLPPMAFNLR
jgi:gliding motility-associated protein GldM